MMMMMMDWVSLIIRIVMGAIIIIMLQSAGVANATAEVSAINEVTYGNRQYRTLGNTQVRLAEGGRHHGDKKVPTVKVVP